MKEEKRKCLRCGEEFIPPHENSVYCSVKCRTRDCSKKRYEKLKNNPSFKKKAKANWEAWYAKNKEKFNEDMRVYMRKKLEEDEEYRKKQKEYEHNPKRIAHRKEYERTHKRERNEYQRKYQILNKDKLNEIKRKWTNSEKGKAYYKEYYKKQKEKNENNKQ